MSGDESAERLKAGPASFPPPVSLFVDPTRVAQWGGRLGGRRNSESASLGRARFGMAHLRSSIVRSRWPRFESVAQIPGVRLISLQKGHGVEQLAGLRAT
jgi:hypothetical protein